MTNIEWKFYRNGILDALDHLDYEMKSRHLSPQERASWIDAQLVLYDFYNATFPRQWVDCTERGEEIPSDSIQPFPPRK